MVCDGWRRHGYLLSAPRPDKYLRAAGSESTSRLRLPVPVEVAGLDHAGEVGRGAEDLGAPLLEGLAGAAVQEGAVGLGVAGLGVVAAVGEQQVDAAVPVEVGEFDLVGPLGCRRKEVAGGVVSEGGGHGSGRGVSRTGHFFLARRSRAGHEDEREEARRNTTPLRPNR